MWKPRSLAGRMAVSVAFASLASGTIVALVTGMLSNRLARAQEDVRLRDAAVTLGYELQTQPATSPETIADNETLELTHTGISVAIFEGKRYVAGNLDVPRVDPGICDDVAAKRVCGVTAGPWTVSAARDRALPLEHRETIAEFALGAITLTSLLSSVIALVLVRRTVEPLEQLASAVHHIPEHEPQAAQLGVDQGLAEVDALRGSLRSTLDRLGGALTQSRSFAANAAHQLRTPLTTIIGELELALEQSKLESRDEIARAHRVAVRLCGLLDRLLILARPHEALPMTAELSLVDAIEEAIAAIPEPARQRIRYEAEPVQLRADPALVVSAITSAIENGLKFSSGPVRVFAAEQGSLALLAVEDDGPGIVPAERERVFAPF